MSKSIDIDKAGECLRNILDTNRCGICDKLSRNYWRCEHGHIACGDCSTKEEGCLTCFTTFNSPVTSNSWVEDKSQTIKTSNALNLLNTFQDNFKIDVYKRQRISDQLKVEKELFPDCIQAPVKYINKKKTLNSTIYNKENSQQTYYPGEKTSPLPSSKMEKSKYVQKWLSSNSENTMLRKPLSNINVSNQILSGRKLRKLNSRAANNSRKVKNRILRKEKTVTTRSKTETVCCTLNEPSLNRYFRTPTKNVTNMETASTMDQLHKRNKGKLNKRDDSGIVIDDDSEEMEVMDKDKLALRAVHEAEKNESSLYDSLYEEADNAQEIKEDKNMKVPYIKKSLLYEPCPNCNLNTQNHDSIKEKSSNNISITIEYDSVNQTNKQSIAVQTEISDINECDNSSNLANFIIRDNAQHEPLESYKKCPLDEEVDDKSQDLFMDDKDILKTLESHDLCKKICHKSAELLPLSKNRGVIIIDESDSDAEPEHSQTTAEVHRSCEPHDYDILTEMDLIEMKNRKRRAKRGATPGSTDSSEKENFDPNRIKRSKYTKKGKKKPNKS